MEPIERRRRIEKLIAFAETEGDGPDVTYSDEPDLFRRDEAVLKELAEYRLEVPAIAKIVKMEYAEAGHPFSYAYKTFEGNFVIVFKNPTNLYYPERFFADRDEKLCWLDALTDLRNIRALGVDAAPS